MLLINSIEQIIYQYKLIKVVDLEEQYAQKWNLRYTAYC